MSITKINTNIDALQAIANLYSNQNLMTQTLKRLSTGLRINSAGDDPSAMGQVSGFKRQISGTEMSIQNAQEGLSLLDLADGALNETQDVLLRMKDLAVKAANTATITTAQISQINTELQSLKAEVTRKSSAISFNSKYLFSGGFANGIPIQVGADNASANMLTITMQAVTLSNLFLVTTGIWGNGVGTGPGSLAISNMPGATVASTAYSYAQMAMTYLNSAINIVSNVRANIGVQQSRLNYIINDLNTMDVNYTSALSRVQDADMASEIAKFAKQQVLAQFGIATLAQANVGPSQLLSLMGTSSSGN